MKIWYKENNIVMFIFAFLHFQIMIFLADMAI